MAFGPLKSLIRCLCIISIICISSVVATSCGSSKKTVRTVQSSTNKPEKKDNKKQKAAPENVAEALISEAREWIGTPYRYGGKEKGGADCSGFIMQVYKAVTGIPLPRTTQGQRDFCTEIKKDDLAAGDLIFFSSKAAGGKTAHVGMYLGNGTMIHASSSRGVIESSINSSYYVKYYLSSGRVPGINDAIPTAKSAASKPEEPITAPPVPTPQPVEQPDIVTPVPAAPEPEKKESPETIVKNAFNNR